VKGANAGRYVPSGHLVYVRGNVLFAAPFDAVRLAVTGTETPVVENISDYDYAFSQTGVLAFAPADDVAASSIARLEWMDRKGATQPLEAPAKQWFGAVVSPDGLSVVAGIDRDLWKFDTVRGTLTKLATGGDSPSWSRDGQWVSYRTLQGGKTAIYRIRADSSRAPELLVTGGEDSFVGGGAWVSDGSFVFQRVPKTSTTADPATWMLLTPAGQERRLLETGSDAIHELQVSPDGKTVAYSAGEFAAEVYVAASPGPGAKIQISTKGGTNPKWSRDGKELFYTEGSWFEAAPRLMSVNMTTDPPGRPQVVATLLSRFFEVTPNPNRFLVKRPPEGQDRGSPIVVITNWFEDLLRLVPVGK
jgi:serine/threonine-protein kinase